jgi:histone-lysine N-methyltransferase ASH1L
LSVLGKRGRDAIDEASFKIKRELRRLADTNEFAKIETKPVVHEVWSCGKLVTGNEPPKKERKKAEEPVIVNQVWSRGKLITEPAKKKEADEPIIIHEIWSRGKLVTGNEPPKKKAKVEAKEPEPEPVEEKPKVKKVKKWLNRGLYAGQEAIVDLSHSYTAKERKAMAKANAEVKRRSILPLPLWAGQRLLLNGRDFKLPFDVCSPLPPGQPKPDEWRKTTKSKPPPLPELK